MDSEHGVIFDIQHCSTHDGPGVRSTVFFKGCPLSCAWCSNPESQQRKPELLHFADLCNGCRRCVDQCANGALAPGGRDAVHIRPERCKRCGACAAVCPRGARSLAGKMMSVADVVDEVRQHWRIFMQSGGGITCGGGEALHQPSFLEALLHALHEEVGFHTCLDTCGYAPWSVIERMLPYADMILLDLKHMDDARHRKGTGRGNKRILDNAARLARSAVPILIRLPLIPGFNDDEENIRALGAFMRKNGLFLVEVLPHHEFGASKHRALGRRYTTYAEGKSKAETTEKILKAYGLNVSVVKRDERMRLCAQKGPASPPGKAGAVEREEIGKTGDGGVNEVLP